MIFRRLAQHLREQNWTAIVIEFVLLVVGVFLGIQVANWNEERRDRDAERAYLVNLRVDLSTNLDEMDRYLATRTERIAAAKRILEHFNGRPIEDVSAFNADGIGIYSWERFYLVNNTYQELVNSGNFALLRNQAIKTQILDIEALYQKMKGEEDHYRFDTETALYQPIYALMDTEAMTADFVHRMSGGKAGRHGAISVSDFDDFLANVTIKNGFVMTVLEYDKMNDQMRELRSLCEQLIAAIDKDLGGRQ